MTKKTKKTLIIYIVCLLLGGFIAGSIIFSREWSSSSAENYTILSDGFSVPGVIMLAVATIIWLSGEGAFDAVGFVTGKALRALIPFSRTHELKGETYQEYKERKHPHTQAKGDSSVNYKAHILICGAFFVLISGIFAILFLV